MSMSVAKQAFTFDLPAVCTELRAAAKGIAARGEGHITVPPPMTVGWLLIAMLDSTSDYDDGTYASEDFLAHKTGMSKATLYRVLNLFEEVGAMTRKTESDGRVYKIWHLDKLPRKAEWVRPHRGRPRSITPAENGSQVAIKGSQLEKSGSQLEKSGSQVATKPPPLRLPEVQPIADPAPSEQRSDPDMIQDRSYTDPPLSGRILDATPLWLKVRETLRKEFRPAQWDSWVEPLRLYRAEDSGEYIMTGRSLAQVDMTRKTVHLFRYYLARELGTPVELRVMHQLDLEQAAAHGRDTGTSLVYPPLAPAGTGG